MYNWENKPTKAEVKYTARDSDEGPLTSVYSVGKYDVSVHPDGSVTYMSDRNTGPGANMPEVVVDFDEIRFRIEDFVPLILSRLEPVELAEHLWRDQDTRDQFMHFMTSQYNDPEFSDDDRRAFLSSVKATVHNEALDKAVNRLRAMECEFAKAHNYRNQMNRINRHLEVMNVRGHDGKLTQFDMFADIHNPFLKVGGEAWEAALEYWRGVVAKVFLAPEEPEICATCGLDHSRCYSAEEPGDI
jgi:hypothetical protein